MATTTSKSTFTKPYTTGTSTPIFNASSLKPYMEQIFGLGSPMAPDTSNPFGFQTDVNVLKGNYDAATNASFDAKRQEGTQNLNRFDNINYQNRANTLSDARSAMLGGIQSNANTGANSAAIMQALAAGSQAGSMETTAALQELQNIASQRQAAMAQNAVTAQADSNAAIGQQATSAGVFDTNSSALRGSIGGALGQAIQGAMAGTNQKSYGRDIASITETTKKDSSGGSGGSSSYRNSGGSSGGKYTNPGSPGGPNQPKAPDKTAQKAAADKVAAQKAAANKKAQAKHAASIAANKKAAANKAAQAKKAASNKAAADAKARAKRIADYNRIHKQRATDGPKHTPAHKK